MPGMLATLAALCLCSARVMAINFYNPADKGGSLLTEVLDTYPEGQHEPVNTIISGDSDAEVLTYNANQGGMLNYFLSLHFGTECLQQHIGNSQKVDLGDGNGSLNESAVIRWNYYDPGLLGTCKESQNGGNHFRFWIQNGSEANSGAYFLATSYEKSAAEQHSIVSNGYNLGRDYLVGNITNNTIPTDQLSGDFDASSFNGYTSSNGWTYYTEISYISGLYEATSDGINHSGDVASGDQTAVDGLVAVLSVKVHERGSTDSSSGSDGSDGDGGDFALSLQSTSLAALSSLAMLLGVSLAAL